MSLQTYNLMHVIGIVLLSIGIGIWYSSSKNTKLLANSKKLIMSINGIGVLLILVSGFGQMARLSMFANIPSWIWIKLAIWLIIAVTLPMLFLRSQQYKLITIFSVVLIIVAAFFGIYKP